MKPKITWFNSQGAEGKARNKWMLSLTTPSMRENWKKQTVKHKEHNKDRKSKHTRRGRRRERDKTRMAMWVIPASSGVSKQRRSETDRRARAGRLASVATRMPRHTTRQGPAYRRSHTRVHNESSVLHHASATTEMWNIQTGTKVRHRSGVRGPSRGKEGPTGVERGSDVEIKAEMTWRSDFTGLWWSRDHSGWRSRPLDAAQEKLGHSLCLVTRCCGIVHYL